MESRRLGGSLAFVTASGKVACTSGSKLRRLSKWLRYRSAFASRTTTTMENLMQLSGRTRALLL